jgi:hypothetical protein
LLHALKHELPHCRTLPHTAALPHCRTAALPHCRTAAHCHTAALPHCRILLHALKHQLPHCRTAAHCRTLPDALTVSSHTDALPHTAARAAATHCCSHCRTLLIYLQYIANNKTIIKVNYFHNYTLSQQIQLIKSFTFNLCQVLLIILQF